MRYALIKNGEVRNVILWDGETAFELREGETLLPEAEAVDLPRYSPQAEPEPGPETVDVGGLTLRAEQEDRQRFVELLTLLREAEGLGMLPATTLISDAAGVAHDLPTATVRQLLVGYGAALQARWNADKLSEQP